MRKLLVSAVVTASFALVGVAPAAAGPNPTPNDGRCGAANMANEHSAEQMAEAMMLHTDEHGDAGMFKAVAKSSCDTD